MGIFAWGSSLFSGNAPELLRTYHLFMYDFRYILLRVILERIGSSPERQYPSGGFIRNPYGRDEREWIGPSL